jgi:hypothetical protein
MPKRKSASLRKTQILTNKTEISAEKEEFISQKFEN